MGKVLVPRNVNMLAFITGYFFFTILHFFTKNPSIMRIEA